METPREALRESGRDRFVFGDAFLYRSGVGWGGWGCFAICCLYRGCEDTRSGAGDMSHASMSPCTSDAKIRLQQSFLLFHLTLARARLRTHTQIFSPLFRVCAGRTFKGLGVPLSANKANLGRNGGGEVTPPRPCQFQETLCTKMHTLEPPCRRCSCRCSS